MASAKPAQTAEVAQDEVTNTVVDDAANVGHFELIPAEHAWALDVFAASVSHSSTTSSSR